MKRKDIFYISFAQVICALSVVFLHVNGCFWTFSTDSYWFSANIIECVFYFAVPVFFMVTGITLIDYQDRYSTKEYFKRRIVKTGIPFLSWSLIGFFYVNRSAIYHHTFDYHTLSPVNLINGILSTEYIHIYWFFIELFSVYMCIPLFASIPKQKRKSLFIPLILGGGGINNLIPFVIDITGINVQWPFSIYVAGKYLFYVILGVVLHEYKPNRKERAIIYVLGIAGFSLHCFGTYYFSVRAGEIIQLFKGYLSIPCIAYSTAIFELIQQLGIRISKSNKTQSIVEIIDYCKHYTYPVYLMHIYIVFILFSYFTPTSLLFRMLAPFAVFAIVIPITNVMCKIPPLRIIVP